MVTQKPNTITKGYSEWRGGGKQKIGDGAAQQPIIFRTGRISIKLDGRTRISIKTSLSSRVITRITKRVSPWRRRRKPQAVIDRHSHDDEAVA